MNADLQAITIARRDGWHAGRAAKPANVVALASAPARLSAAAPLSAVFVGVEWLR